MAFPKLELFSERPRTVKVLTTTIRSIKMLNFKTTVLSHEVYDAKGRLREKSTLRSRELSLRMPLIGTLAIIG